MDTLIFPDAIAMLVQRGKRRPAMKHHRINVLCLYRVFIMDAANCSVIKVIQYILIIMIIVIKSKLIE